MLALAQTTWITLLPIEWLLLQTFGLYLWSISVLVSASEIVSSYSVGLNNFFSNSAQFSEHLVLLPHSYFVTDHRQQPAWAGIPDPSVSRKEYPELPGSGLLLACFNQVIITWFSVCCSLLVLNSIRTQISRFDIWYCMICSQLYKIDSEVFGVWMQVLLARCFFLIIIIILYCDVVPFHFQKTVYIWRMGFVASILRGRGQIFC